MQANLTSNNELKHFPALLGTGRLAPAAKSKQKPNDGCMEEHRRISVRYKTKDKSDCRPTHVAPNKDP